jgi:N-glycosylase/DNA lyase
MISMTIPYFDLQQIADSGQCFRMTKLENNRYQVLAGNHLLYVQQEKDYFTFDCTSEEFESFWKSYFDLDTDYSIYINAIPPEDSFLQMAVTAGGGIRILRQDKWEMLITFLLSQRKNIPAIKKSVEALCRLCGTPIQNGLYAFPTPEQLAACSIEELERCSLGYRAKYIYRAAATVAADPACLERCAAFKDEELSQFLLSFYGVGVKVSNCVMLFGYHRIAAFPVDVWMNRILEQVYHGQFPLGRYEGFAGVIQQYMFYYGRIADLSAY